MIVQVHVQLETDERWDVPMGGIQTADQVNVQSGDRIRGWERMIKCSNNWPSSRTLWRLSGDRWRGWDGVIKWGIQTKFTYTLGIWKTMKKMGWIDKVRKIQSIDEVHETRTSWRRIERMVWRVLSQQVQVWRTIGASTSTKMFRNSTTLRPWFHSWNEIVSHIADCNHQDSATWNSAIIILTTGATPHLPSQRFILLSVGIYSSVPEPFPCLLPTSLRSYS